MAQRRNVPINLFANYLNQIPVTYVNLQYGDTDQELSQMAAKFRLNVNQINGLDLFNDLDGLAALISACDIVISIDNITVHLSGALGIDTRVLVPFVPDERWGLQSRISYWYDSLKLYRQVAQGDWHHPMQSLVCDLVRTQSLQR